MYLNKNSFIISSGDLLRVNDDLNNVFLRYERFERYRTGQAGQVSTPVSEPTTHDSLPPAYDQVISIWLFRVSSCFIRFQELVFVAHSQVLYWLQPLLSQADFLSVLHVWILLHVFCGIA